MFPKLNNGKSTLPELGSGAMIGAPSDQWKNNENVRQCIIPTVGEKSTLHDGLHQQNYAAKRRGSSRKLGFIRGGITL